MAIWKNLKSNPPKETCNICLKVGVTYDTFVFRRYTNYSWDLYKFPKAIGPEKVPNDALYINLDEIIWLG